MYCPTSKVLVFVFIISSACRVKICQICTAVDSSAELTCWPMQPQFTFEVRVQYKYGLAAPDLHV